MVQIPRNGFADAGFKGEGRVVSKVCGYFVRVDGVAAVVAGPVGDMGDERFAGGSFGWWCLGESFCQCGICFKQVVKDCADQVDDVQVDLFIVAADVVGFSDFALVQDQVYAQVMIVHIEPVPDLHAVSVYRDGLVVQDVGDHQGDQLFRELERAVIVGTVGGGDLKAVGFVVGPDQMVGRGLAGGIG